MHRRASRLFTILLLGSLSVAAGGCGNSRTRPADLRQPALPSRFQWVAYPDSGLLLKAPTNWLITRQRSPLLTVISSGNAVVAVWRFPRSSPPPVGPVAIGHATVRLLAAARARDATLRLIRSASVSLGNRRAIELDAFERIGGQPRRVRSTHVFVAGAEVVLEEYAPPAMFHAVDHAVFSPLKRSLRLLPAGG